MTPRFKSLFGRRLLAPMLVFLFISAIYLYAFPQPNVVYAGVVLAHALVGLIAGIYLLVLLFGLLRRSTWMARLGWVLLLVSAGIGIALLKVGTPRSEWNWLYLHIVLALVASGLLFADWAGQRGWLTPGLGRAALRYSICTIALAGLAWAGYYSRNSRWQNSLRIQNPSDSPESMNDEGDGPQ